MAKTIEKVQKELIDYIMNVNHSALTMIVKKHNPSQSLIEQYKKLYENYEKDIFVILNKHLLNFDTNILCVEINDVPEIITFTDRNKLDFYLEHLKKKYEKVTVIYIK